MAMTTLEAEKMLDALLAQISEHFDAVQILASRPCGNAGTQGFTRGIGNYFARQGMAREFLDHAQAKTNADEIAPLLDRPDSDDSWNQP